MMDSRQEYRLSYFVLMTLSFTFMAGTESLLLWLSWYSLCTPVTLSSTIPFSILNTAGYFLTMTWVASPPSSRIMFGCQDSSEMVLSMHHQKSSSLSPLQANTGMPASARAAATSFWVL